MHCYHTLEKACIYDARSTFLHNYCISRPLFLLSSISLGKNGFLVYLSLDGRDLSCIWERFSRELVEKDLLFKAAIGLKLVEGKDSNFLQ